MAFVVAAAIVGFTAGFNTGYNLQDLYINYIDDNNGKKHCEDAIKNLNPVDYERLYKANNGPLFIENFHTRYYHNCSLVKSTYEDKVNCLLKAIEVKKLENKRN